MNNREIIARRVAREFRDGDIVNLGIGIPTLAVNYVPEGMRIWMHSESGILGVGAAAAPDLADQNVTDASGNRVTVLPGASFFDSAMSFALIRGGHIDCTVLGTLQVDQYGSLANWMVPGSKVTGMGGAMDLVCGARRVIVAMEHLDKQGKPKIVAHYDMPLTAEKQVDLIITNLGVFSVDHEKGLTLTEIADGLTPEQLQGMTGAPFSVSEQVRWRERGY